MEELPATRHGGPVHPLGANTPEQSVPAIEEQSVCSLLLCLDASRTEVIVFERIRNTVFYLTYVREKPRAAESRADGPVRGAGAQMCDAWRLRFPDLPAFKGPYSACSLPIRAYANNHDNTA